MGPIKYKIVGYADCGNYIRALTFRMFHVNEIKKFATPDNWSYLMLMKLNEMLSHVK